MTVAFSRILKESKNINVTFIIEMYLVLIKLILRLFTETTLKVRLQTRPNMLGGRQPGKHDGVKFRTTEDNSIQSRNSSYNISIQILCPVP